MSFSKTTLTLLGISGLAVSTAAGLVISTNAQTSSTSSSVSSVASAIQNLKDNKQAVKTALEKADYEAWKTAIKETRRGDLMLQKINDQTKFDKLVEAYKHIESAQNIKKDLGLPTRETVKANMQAAKDALDKNDYEAWKTAIKDNPQSTLATQIDTQEKFDKFSQAHKYMQNGEMDKAKAIFAELGIKNPMGGMFKGKGMKFGRNHMKNANSSEAGTEAQAMNFEEMPEDPSAIF